MEIWDLETSKSRLECLGIDLSNSFTPKRIDDATFGVPNGKEIQGAVFCPTTGYVSDPTLAVHNLMEAAETCGAQFFFNQQVKGINQGNGRVTGITLEDGQKIEVPIVLNAAGPESSKINDLAFPDCNDTVPNDMLVQTRGKLSAIFPIYSSPIVQKSQFTNKHLF